MRTEKIWSDSGRKNVVSKPMDRNGGTDLPWWEESNPSLGEVHRISRSSAVVIVPRLVLQVLLCWFILRPPTGKYLLDFLQVDRWRRITSRNSSAWTRKRRYWSGWWHPALHFTGLLSESCFMAFVSIDEEIPQNRFLRQKMSPVNVLRWLF